MEKKDKKPPADKPRGESKAEKEAERLERERLRKINRVPDYEALFREQGYIPQGNRLFETGFPKGLGQAYRFVDPVHNQGIADMDHAARDRGRHRPHHRAAPTVFSFAF